MRFRRRVRRVATVGAAVAAVAVACTAVAGAATPIVSIGPTASPTGGALTGTVASNGQTDACLNDQHSGANPSASNAAEGVQVNDSSCTKAAGSGGSGTPASAAAPSASGPDGGGGGGTAASTGSKTSSTSSNQSSTSVSRSAAGSKSRSGSSSRRTVVAANARGVLIATIRSTLVQAKGGKRLRVLVTVRDRQDRLVRSAVVSLGRLPGAKTTLSRLRFGFSNRTGQKAFLVPVTKPMLGRRVAFRIGARTPLAHALRVGTVLLPKQRTHGKVTRFVASG